MATILIVDDTPENLAVLSGLLGRHYRIRAVSSGQRALRVADSEPRPDLILLDVMMPGLDGYQVIVEPPTPIRIWSSAMRKMVFALTEKTFATVCSSLPPTVIVSSVAMLVLRCCPTSSFW